MNKSKLLRLLAVSSTLLIHFLAVSVICEEADSQPAEEPSPAPPPPDPAEEPSPAPPPPDPAEEPSPAPPPPDPAEEPSPADAPPSAGAPPPNNEAESDSPPLSEEGIKKIFQMMQKGKRNRNITRAAPVMHARRRTGKSLSRKALPADWASSSYSSEVECGRSYNLGKEGFLRFDINSNTDCYLGFLGSREDRCTVNVLCDGVVEIGDGNGGDCGPQDNYLRVSDGTIGLSESCGQFSFDGVPLKARNKGLDLYVMYKGSSPDSPCAAFCTEDLAHSEAQVGSPAKLSRSNFKGFPSEEEAVCECGKRKDVGRVVGGTGAVKFEFPWIAGLVFKNYPAYARVPFCDGSLISDSHIITAAHCFDAAEGEKPTLPKDIEAVLHAHVMDPTPNHGQFVEAEAAKSPGWNLPKATDKTENSIRVRIAEIVKHPFYNSETFDYDVAILKLKDKVDLGSKRVAPICLPYMNEQYNFVDNDIMVVAGWGAGEEGAKVTNRLLQKLDVPFVNREACLQHTPAAKRHLCAGYVKGGKDACQGDSGGPLIYNFDPENRQYLLSGVVSSGNGCARRGELGLYTNVQEILQWVYHHSVDEDTLWCSR